VSTFQEAVATSIALLDAQTVKIMPSEFYNYISKEIQILGWNSTPSSTRDIFCMHWDPIAKSLFNRKKLTDLTGTKVICTLD